MLSRSAAGSSSRRPAGSHLPRVQRQLPPESSSADVGGGPPEATRGRSCCRLTGTSAAVDGAGGSVGHERHLAWLPCRSAARTGSPVRKCVSTVRFGDAQVVVARYVEGQLVAGTSYSRDRRERIHGSWFRRRPARSTRERSCRSSAASCAEAPCGLVVPASRLPQFSAAVDVLIVLGLIVFDDAGVPWRQLKRRRAHPRFTRSSIVPHRVSGLSATRQVNARLLTFRRCPDGEGCARNHERSSGSNLLPARCPVS
jgi:hypothetical protein